MRAHGYENRKDDTPLVELVELTLSGEPAELRNLASFLERAALMMEKHGDQCGHQHWRDQPDSTEKLLDVVVVTSHA